MSQKQNYKIELTITLIFQENIWYKSIANRHALGIHFIPTTESYNNYGRNITVTVSENEDLESLFQNFAANPPINTFGNIRLRVLVENNLTPEQIETLDDEGIDTSHISSVLSI